MRVQEFVPAADAGSHPRQHSRKSDVTLQRLPLHQLRHPSRQRRSRPAQRQRRRFRSSESPNRSSNGRSPCWRNCLYECLRLPCGHRMSQHCRQPRPARKRLSQKEAKRSCRSPASISKFSLRRSPVRPANRSKPVWLRHTGVTRRAPPWALLRPRSYRATISTAGPTEGAEQMITARKPADRSASGWCPGLDSNQWPTV